MSKNESIVKEIDFLIQEFRGYFLILIAISTGEASLIYSVLSGEKPIFVMILAVLGLFIFISILLKVKSIKYELYLKLKELSNLEEKK